VTIAVSSGDPSEGVFVGENELGFLKLAFDQNNWDTPQTVTVTGVDDDVEDGDVSYSIDVAVDPLLTVDSDYKTLDSIAVSVTNLDNDGQADYFESQDVPKTIADPHPVKGAKPVTSQLVIASTGITVGVIDVAVTIAHTSMSDLTVTLTSPAGTTAPLAYSNAWDLVAADAFQGQSLDGTWVLTVADTVKNGITGTLTAWSITVTPLAGAATSMPSMDPLGAGEMSAPQVTTATPTQKATTVHNLFTEQNTAPVAEPATGEPVSSASSLDEAITDLDLDALEDPLLEDLALAVL
jgi:subtilisin-like proprotein convertase family protein